MSDDDIPPEVPAPEPDMISPDFAKALIALGVAVLVRDIADDDRQPDWLRVYFGPPGTGFYVLVGGESAVRLRASWGTPGLVHVVPTPPPGAVHVDVRRLRAPIDHPN